MATPAVDLAPRVVDLLPAKQAVIARKLGRRKSDGTVRRILRDLEAAGVVVRDVGGAWHRADQIEITTRPNLRVVPPPAPAPEKPAKPDPPPEPAGVARAPARAEDGYPVDFDDDARTLYVTKQAVLEAQGSWKASDGELLEQYVRCEMRARLARADLIGDDGRMRLTTRGSQGQIVQHPNVKTAREAERDAIGYADALGLTPEGRKRLGISDEPDDDDFDALD